MIQLISVAAVAASLVAAATIAARVWGQGVGGVISAFPLIVGPALLLGALRQGGAFASEMAVATLLGLVALSGFALAYGRAAPRCGWLLSLAIAWAAAAALGTAAGGLGAGLVPALAGGVASLAVARAGLPRAIHAEMPATLPRWDLPARMTLTALLIVGLTAAGGRFGPTVEGILAALPVLASVLAVFTHVRHGHEALVAMLRGMLGGLAAFATFCALIALLIEPAGVPAAFVVATAAAVAMQLLSARAHATVGLRTGRRYRARAPGSALG